MNDKKRRERFISYFQGPPLNGDRLALIKRSRLSKGRVSQLFDENESFGELAAKNLAERLGLDREFFTSEVGRTPSVQEAHPAYVAHLLSLDRPDTAPTIPWEDLMSTHVPDVFRVELPDDAMAPNAAKGTELVFSTEKQPKPGSWVLVKDEAGNFYVRQYRFRRPGDWSAYAINESFQPLHVERDGIEIVAVMTWANIDHL